MNDDTLLSLSNLIKKLHENTTRIYSRIPVLIVILPPKIASIIGDNRIHLSEFVLAKIKGKIKGYSGHCKITDSVILKVPESLSNPFRILEDKRKNTRKEYLFINNDPLHQIVVETERKHSGFTEINTIFDTTLSELKRLEGKLPTVYSSGETPISRIHASD